MEENIINTYRIARRIAKKCISDKDTVDEVVQLTVIQYSLNIDKIDEQKLVSWVFVVVKNFINQYYRNIAKDNKLRNVIKYEQNALPEDNFTDTSDVENSYDKEQLHKDIEKFSFLSQQEKKILISYSFENKTVSEIARNMKIKKATLQSKLSRLLGEVKFYYLLQSEPYAFDPIPSTKFLRNLNNFISKIKQAIEDNNLYKLKRYLQYCKINDSISKIEIKNVRTYKVIVSAPNKYKVGVLYSDYNNKKHVFMFSFVLTKNYSIKVTEFPIIPKMVVTYNKDYAEGESGYRMLTDDKGRPNNRFGGVKKILKKGIGKVIQTKADFD